MTLLVTPSHSTLLTEDEFDAGGGRTAAYPMLMIRYKKKLFPRTVNQSPLHFAISQGFDFTHSQKGSHTHWLLELQHGYHKLGLYHSRFIN